MRRVLVDECLPVQLRQWLEGFDVRTVAFMGWKGKRDGELLAAAKGMFDVLLTERPVSAARARRGAPWSRGRPADDQPAARGRTAGASDCGGAHDFAAW
jgi:hypothetical protein